MNEKNTGRYQVPNNEDFEPGSHDSVLKNYLGITSSSEIEALEEQELKRIIVELEGLFNQNYQFISEDLCAIHEGWLGDIYPMAGKYRSVSMSKGDFPFAAPTQIEKLMEAFEEQYLKKYTPCNFKSINEVIEALAIVHVEFILIHPFREGNGRLGRLLASLMANQANLPPLNFEPIDQNINPQGFEYYIRGIHKGLDCNYQLMSNIFREVIEISKKINN